MKTNYIENINAIEREAMATHEANQKDAVKNARSFGWANKPKPAEAINPYVRPYIESYGLSFQRIKKELSKLLFEIEHELALCRSAISQLIEKRTSLEKQITEGKSNLTTLVVNFTWLSVLKLYVIEFLLLIAETAFNGFAFQIFGGSLIFSLFISAGITIAIVLLYHVFQLTLAYAKTTPLKAAILVSWVLFITLFFYYLATFRNMYLQQNNLPNEISTVAFIVVNWVLLIAAGYVFSKFPSRKERRDKKEYNRVMKELKGLQVAHTKLMTELNAAETEEKLLVSDRNKITSHDLELEKWISGLMRSTLSIFISENISARSDGHSQLNTFDQNDFLNTNLKLN